MLVSNHGWLKCFYTHLTSSNKYGIFFYPSTLFHFSAIFFKVSTLIFYNYECPNFQ
ncbi:hypothetical protein MtrunA17_Chr8g0387341 [Medicago truncatula]|uniref:Transmembrane protein n=1 Tax=Medicago truncatula TaxID=3880 RepID=A0A396GS96_MEDTR|nr:hypothetical protein MtrunA17_Chr8g0387341 [Medicago truncatula]